MSRTVIDVGGAYTDLFLFDGATGRFATAKTPSQRGDEARGFLAGLDALGRVADFHAIVHGARVALIATPGFRDVLEMRRRDRPRRSSAWR